MGRRGGPTVVLPFYFIIINFLSASLSLPVLYKHITYVHASKFNVLY